MKRAILPKLLGFKITIISIIPIIFGLIYLITKKAMFLSKLALLVTSFVGFSSIAKVNKFFSAQETKSPAETKLWDP